MYLGSLLRKIDVLEDCACLTGAPLGIVIAFQVEGSVHGNNKEITTYQNYTLKYLEGKSGR
jgi:hypothetical protein